MICYFQFHPKLSFLSCLPFVINNKIYLHFKISRKAHFLLKKIFLGKKYFAIFESVLLWSVFIPDTHFRRARRRGLYWFSNSLSKRVTRGYGIKRGKACGSQFANLSCFVMLRFLSAQLQLSNKKRTSPVIPLKVIP